MQLNQSFLAQLGVANPQQPVTRGEVAQYVAHIVLAERARIAAILKEIEGYERLSATIGDRTLTADEFGWR